MRSGGYIGVAGLRETRDRGLIRGLPHELELERAQECEARAVVGSDSLFAPSIYSITR